MADDVFVQPDAGYLRQEGAEVQDEDYDKDDGDDESRGSGLCPPERREERLVVRGRGERRVDVDGVMGHSVCHSFCEPLNRSTSAETVEKERVITLSLHRGKEASAKVR